MPAETSRAIVSLLMGGVLERYPKLRFAFAHGGGSFPATLGRINHGFDVRPDLCQVETTTPPSEFVDKLYFDSLVHDDLTLKFLVDKIGADRLALGTDYPFPLGEHRPGRLVEGSDLPAEVKERILSGSALEWLDRKREDYETDASKAHSRSIGFEV
jgi:aminocarboxymuconate-semialdehyde decarboxylase